MLSKDLYTGSYFEKSASKAGVLKALLAALGVGGLGYALSGDIKNEWSKYKRKPYQLNSEEAEHNSPSDSFLSDPDIQQKWVASITKNMSPEAKDKFLGDMVGKTYNDSLNPFKRPLGTAQAYRSFHKALVERARDNPSLLANIPGFSANYGGDETLTHAGVNPRMIEMMPSSFPSIGKQERARWFNDITRGMSDSDALLFANSQVDKLDNDLQSGKGSISESTAYNTFADYLNGRTLRTALIDSIGKRLGKEPLPPKPPTIDGEGVPEAIDSILTTGGTPPTMQSILRENNVISVDERQENIA